MTTSVLLDACGLPTKGPVDLMVKRKFIINITAEEAQRLVHAWLFDTVSCNISAEAPTLVIGVRPVWRVPAYLSFPRFGRVGVVGMVDVDVETGAMQNPLQCKAAIEHTATELAERLPSYTTPQTMPKAFVPVGVALAEKLDLTEADLLAEEEPQQTAILETTP